MRIFSSTNSTSCGISAKPSTRFAKRNMRGSRGSSAGSIKGQKYVLLSQSKSARAGKQSLKLLLKANKRLNTAYILRESFAQLWTYNSEVWARKFFDNWRMQLRWRDSRPTKSSPLCSSVTGTASPPTANPKTKSPSASLKGSTTR